MTKAIILPLAAMALIGLGGCSPKAQNETAEAANTIAADANATMGSAINDVDAASEQAFGAAENKIDHAGDTIANAADDAGDKIDRAGKAARNELAQ